MTTEVAARSSHQLRRALFAAVVAITVVGIALIVAWDQGPFALTFDDAYYYFGIARNLAEGHGSTFDRLNSTNGYHPLWLALCVPFFWVGLNGLAAVRALLAFQMLMYGAAFLLVADAIDGAVDGWERVRRHRGARMVRGCNVVVVTVFVLLVANPFVVKVFVNGLESAVVLVVDAVLLWLVLQGMPEAAPSFVAGRTARWRLGIGGVLAVAFLARTDAVLLVGCLGLWVLLEAWPVDRAGVRALVELFAPVVLTAAAYLAINRAVFGTAVQVSGLVKQAGLDPGRFLAVLGVLAVAGAIFFLTYRRHGRVAEGTRLPLVASFLRRTGWYAAFTVLLVGYYSVLQTQQWLWYYAPAVLYGVWIVALLVADIMGAAVVESDPQTSTVRAIGPIAVLLVLPFLVAAALQTRIFADPDLRSIQVANRDAGEWIDANLPEDAVLASWDAGVVGYFADRHVINLDGVVNSLEWHRATERGSTAAFLRDENLGWVVNHGADVNGRDPAIDGFIRSEFGQTALDGSSVVGRWPFVFSGVTTGSAGTTSPGTAPQAVFLYQLPPP